MPRIARFQSLLAAFSLLLLLVGSSAALAGGPKVEIYVTSWCPYCAKAKAYFAGKGIPFTAYDIEKDQEAAQRFQRYGQRGVPLVIINGQAIAGYAVAAYEQALATPDSSAPAHAPASGTP